MGHLTLMSEDVILALARFPPELRLHLMEYAPNPGWDEYVTGRYDETKKKDTKVLGGGRPNPSNAGLAGPGKGTTRWKVDEGEEAGSAKKIGEIKGEFKRGVGNVTKSRQTADFGPPPSHDNDEEEEEEGEKNDPQPAPQVCVFSWPLIRSRL
jgi:serine/threonine-protein phosphatase 6 regulatory subunit 3